jgi:hypothetical protein
MSVIYDSPSISLKKTGDYWELSIDNSNDFGKSLPLSKLDIISRVTNSGLETIVFKAEKVQTLESILTNRLNFTKRLNYTTASNLFNDLSKQLQSLEVLNLGLSFLCTTDIVVVDGKHFFHLNNRNVHNIVNGTEMVIDLPRTTSLFISPEMLGLTNFPMKIHFKSGYYSMGSLVLYCLTGNLVNETTKTKILESINTTQLHNNLILTLKYLPVNRVLVI